MKNYLNKLIKKFNISKTISSTFILGFGSASEKGIRLLRNIILTRLLAPEIFGIMAVTLVVIQTLESIANFGTNYAIIQSKLSRNDEFLNIAFFVSILRSITLYTLLFLLSPLIAKFYNIPELSTYIKIASLSIVFSGLFSPRAHLLVKDMKFFKWIVISNFSGIFAVIVTISLSFFYRNVWVLVIGYMSESIFRFMASYIMVPFKPSFKFDEKMSADLIRFVKGILGLGLIYFIYNKGEIFVIGKLCTTYELGLYSVALSLANAPLGLLSNLLDKIGLARFSQLQDDSTSMKLLLLKITKILAALLLPITLFLPFVGGDLLGFLYGEKYSAVVIPFSIAFGTAGIRLLGIPVSQIYFSKGKPELQRYFSIIGLIVFLLSIYPLTNMYGLSGAALSSLLSLVSGLSYQIMRIKLFFPFSLSAYSKQFIFPLIISIAGLILFLVILNFYYGFWGRLVLEILILGFVYLVILIKNFTGIKDLVVIKVSPTK